MSEENDDTDLTKHKMFSYTLPQYGLFITRQFDAHDVGVSLSRMSGFLDWKLNWFGWQIGVWIERCD